LNEFQLDSKVRKDSDLKEDVQSAILDKIDTED